MVASNPTLQSEMPTRRERIIELLELGKYTPKDLARLLEVKVVEVLDDLEHVRKSIGKKLEIVSAFCSACEYTFEDRKRLNTPSRCPKCRAERVSGPWLTIEPEATQA
jgi:transcriptional regulator